MKKIALIILTALIITMMMPQRGLVDTSIGRGETWKQESVVAPFDIPIYKSNSELDADINATIENFQPIFRLDTTIAARHIAAATEKLSKLPEQISIQLIGMLRFIYSKGVILEGDKLNYPGKTVRISNDNILHSQPIDELFTFASIERYIISRGIKPTALIPFIQPNLSYDKALNDKVRAEAVSGVSRTRGMVRSGEILIANGQIVDRNTEKLLNSYKTELERRLGLGTRLWMVMIGRFLLVLLILSINYTFFTQFASNYIGTGIRELGFILLLYIVMSAIVAFAVKVPWTSSYMVPLSVVGVYLLTFFNMRVAIFGNISVALMSALFVSAPFEFFIINFSAGMTAIFIVRHFYRRNSLFKAIGFIFATEVVVYISFALIRGANFVDINYLNIAWFVVNNFLMLAFYQLVYLIERLFGFVSDVTLLELCDTNQPLLLQLAEKAPGTFQHSVQVANLAEGAAAEIGANPLLARTGALYHDIGKMQNPFYFVENLSGTFNPHNDLLPQQSADIVRNHVTDGVAIARKNGVPAKIIEFISGHHGTSLIYFFYAAEKRRSGEDVDSENFRYPGPNPVGKEVSICMMADAIEAASRSLPSYEKELIDELVEKIVDIQISERQFVESELSFSEIAHIKRLFKAKLNNIYHGRIAYPEREKAKK